MHSGHGIDLQRDHAIEQLIDAVTSDDLASHLAYAPRPVLEAGAEHFAVVRSPRPQQSSGRPHA